MTETWMERLYMLVERFPRYVVGADLGAMTRSELWGVFRFLSGTAEGGQP